jgi:hypothetical protein
MSKKNYPHDILEQANELQSAWAKIDEALVFGKLGMAELVTEINRLRAIDLNLTDLETQMNELRNERDDVSLSTWDKVKRARAGFKSFFGDDSSEYDLAGGTRARDRKSPRRTAQPVE